MKDYNGFIYETKNLITGRKYIGRHGRSGDQNDPDDSWYLGSGVALNDSIVKYGLDNFTRTIIDPGPLTIEEAIEREEYFLNLYDCANNPDYYNLTNTSHAGFPVLEGESHPGYGKPSPFAGRHHTEEAKQKIRESLRDRVVSEETRRHLSESLKGHPAHNKGVPMTSQQKEKMITSLTGRHLSEDHKRNISKATKGSNNPMYGRRGESNPNYGRHHTEDSINKIREFNKGRIFSTESIERMKSANKRLDYPRICKSCGINFLGGKSARYCSNCKK